MLSSPLGLGYQPRVVLFRKKRTKEQKIQPVTQTLRTKLSNTQNFSSRNAMSKYPRNQNVVIGFPH